MGLRRRRTVVFASLRLLRVLLALAVLAPVVAPERADADILAAPAAADKAAAPPAKGRRPPPPRAYTDLCAQGNARYATRDFAGAIERYHRAIARAPNQPLGYYLLGEAELAEGNLADAEIAWNRAVLEAGEIDLAMHARSLFVLADLHERRGEWDAARAAWQTYIDWVTRFPESNGVPASAHGRIDAIDARRKQDEAYEPVRKRIAETADGGVFTDLTKPSPNK